MTEPAPTLPPRRARIVLLAGPSGSGKGVLAQRLGLPVVQLDEFYRNGDDPDLPQRYGIVDWDDAGTWDGGAAVAALTDLAAAGRAELPLYSIPTSRRTGLRTLDVDGSPLVIAEGIFAAELIAPLAARGLLADALVIDRPRLLNFALRFLRDVRQARKPLPTLVRRGMGLLRDEPAKMRTWRRAGMVPLPLRRARRRVEALALVLCAEARISPSGTSPRR